MTLGRIVSLCKYPGVKFVLRDDLDWNSGSGILWMDICMMVKDSDPPHDMIKTISTHKIHYRLVDWENEMGIVKWIFDCLTERLQHEAAEWFEFQGKRVFHPHRKEDLCLK